MDEKREARRKEFVIKNENRRSQGSERRARALRRSVRGAFGHLRPELYNEAVRGTTGIPRAVN